MSKNGLILLTPTSIAYTGGSSTATISANGSVTFSACATLSLNGVFTSDYDNYMIVMRHVNSSGNGNGYMRLRAGGVNNTTASSYTWQTLIASSASVSGSRTSTDVASYGPVSATQRSGTIMFVYGPYLSQPTAVRGVTAGGNTSAYIGDSAFTHNQSVSYDGFTLSDSVDVQSGRIAVYGMRK
jgi:hypothetical protein